MGLDQYAYIRDNNEDTLIQQWRKHYVLQDWMDKIWEDKGNKGLMNCRDMNITFDNLQLLESLIHETASPETTEKYKPSGHWEYDKEEDLEFIGNAYDAIRAGKKVIYNGNW